jgi:methionine-rich copper-binding protein CopC
MRSRRMLAVAVLAAALAALIPEPAWAHASLLTTRPAAGATVTEPVPDVVLTFSESIQARFSVIAVDGPDGASYSKGSVTVAGATVRQDVYPLRSGSYRVAWRVVSVDGHPVSGEFRFTVNLPAQLEPSAGPSTAGPVASAAPAGGAPAGGAPAGGASGSSWVSWLIPAAALAGLIAAAVLWLRRTRQAR